MNSIFNQLSDFNTYKGEITDEIEAFNALFTPYLMDYNKGSDRNIVTISNDYEHIGLSRH